MKNLTSNLNLSILELLSVLLPGAMAIEVLDELSFVGKAVKEAINLSSDMKTVGFIAAAYFMGYIIYVIGSKIDDLFDKLKNEALIGKVFKNCKYEFNSVKWWAKVLFPSIDNNYNLLNEVLIIKKRDLGYCEPKPINAFQYSYRRLMMSEQPIMYNEVERYEATSKFFRSMIVVWGLSIFVFVYNTSFFALISLLLLVVSLFVYLNRRQKAINVAYKNIIILDKLAGKKEK